MGLDMYCYRVSKLNKYDLDVIKHCKSSDDLVKKGYEYFVKPNPNDVDEVNMIADLMPYLTPITVAFPFINFDRMKKEKKIPENATIVGSHSDGPVVTFIFSDLKDYRRELTLSAREIDSYWDSEDIESYVCKMKEVGYWRKAYDLQDKIYAACSKVIQNCGYYKLNQDMFDVIVEDGHFYYTELLDDGESAFFYHEWY